jgi:vWA-MoxR associated protein C-terminal domain
VSDILSVPVDPPAANQVTQATGTGSAALGGNVDKTAIVPGNNNDTYQQFGDRQTHITNNFYLGESKDIPPLDVIVVILDQINLEILQQIYRESLPADAKLSIIQPADIDRPQMVLNLHNFRQLPAFIDRLIGDDRTPAGTRLALQLLNLHQSSGSNPVKSSNNRVLESYLSIAIRPSSIPVRVASPLGNRFFVNGWLIADSSIKDNSQRFHPLDLDESDRGIACGLDEIPKVLNNLLELGLQQLKGKQHELTIEIFLPMSCLCVDVDRWKIDDLYAETPVGTKYRTIVRSSDRLEGRYLNRRWSDWCGNWDRITKAGHLTPNCDDFETLDRFTDCNWKRVVNNLSQKLGLKLTCGLESEHKLDLFRAILNAATPIAIWVRCDLPDLDLAAELDALITDSHLFGLSAAVMRKRQQADEEERSEHHLGAHLAMLWEDPGRLTPDAMEWLLTPGQ